jgi:RNA polymerase sigma factor (sigma-70 family)
VSVDGIEERLLAKELFDQVRKAVCRELTPKHAAVLVMYYLQEKSETEIAEMLQCSSNKVSKVKTKALAEARIAMQKRGHYVLVGR